MSDRKPSYGVLWARPAAHAEAIEDAWPLPEPAITLGRSGDCHVLLDDAGVSRRHAEILPGAGGMQIRDLGSANGTWVQGQRLAPWVAWPLQSGDVVVIGPYALRVTGAADSPLAGPPALALSRVRLAPPDLPGLVMVANGQVQKFILDKPALTFGRSADNDIVAAVPVVSGHHARLTASGTAYRLEDAGSLNGLLVGNQRVPSVQLADGGVVSVLDQVWLQYRAWAGFVPPPAAPEPAPLQTLALAPTADRQITLGRAAGNSVQLDDPRVSRRHALIERLGNRFRLRDLSSDNGTFVNGERVKGAVWLQPGDEIQVGGYRLVFASEGLQQLTRTEGLRLDAVHLNKWVSKEKNILQDISLSIYPCEFVALVGVSGAGKSTLMDALNGFRPATNGSVLVNGQDLYARFDVFRSEMGYVPQEDIMHRELTVWKALDYAAQLRMPADTSAGERQRRVAEVLEELGLGERKDLAIDKLSGGQRKRVSIGIELLTKPGLFFLDEATSGLDPGTEAELMNLLRRLADDGRTIILVTHATKNVMMCDKVVFLAKGGNLAFYGPPEEALLYFDRYRSEEQRLVQPDIEFDALYTILENPQLGSPEQWAERYRQSEAYRRYVVARINTLSQALPSGDRGRDPAADRRNRLPPPRRRISSLRQVRVLSSRYINVMRNDRRNLVILLLQAPLIGMTTLISMNGSTYDPVKGSAAKALTNLFLMVIIVMLFGTVNTAREITKEAPIYKRERMVILGIFPYVTSKVLVVFFFCVYQVCVFLIISSLGTDYPALGVSGWSRLVITLLLASMSGALLGLLISAATSSTDQAVALIPVILIPQFIFAGILLPELATSSVAKVATSKWSVEALATITQAGQAGREGTLAEAEATAVARLPAGAPAAKVAEVRLTARNEADKARSEALTKQFGDIFDVDVGYAWRIMGLIMVVLFVLILLFQKLKDRK